MAFTMRQIEIFAEAAKDENFRKTADRLGISQPSISKHITLLEREAGGRLFLRDRGSAARLSPLGKDMLKEAHALLRTAGKVSLSSQPETEESLLRIAVGNYLYDHCVRPLARTLMAQEGMPSIRFIPAMDHEHVRQCVRDGEADYGLYTGVPFPDPDLRVELLRVAEIGIFAAPALAARATSLPGGLSDMPFVLSHEDMKSESWQRNILLDAGIEPRNVSARVQYMDVMMQHVIDGRGAGILFDDDAASLVKAGKLVRLDVALPAGARCMASLATTRPGPRKLRAIRLLREALAADPD